MKSRTLMFVTAMTLFAAVPMPLRLAAQNNQDHNHKHHHYQLIDMGTFGGPVSSNVPFIQGGTLNSRGVTVGWSATSTPTTPTSSFFICGGLDAVVPFITHTFEWQEGVVADLGSLGGADYCSEPFWVNISGEVVGASENGQIDPLLGINQSRAVLWKDGEITDLGSLGGYETAAFGINNHGQITGISTNTIPDPYCFLGTAQLRAFLWDDGQMQDLGTLGGNCAQIGLIDTTLGAINERGQIVGASTTSSIPNPVTGLPPWDPFLWEKGKGMTDLGTLGGVFGGASSINKRAQVIGQSGIAADPGACFGFPDNGNSNCHAFLWDRGTLTDLTTSSIGGNPSFLAGIDDAGEIIGTGAFPNAPQEAFLWRKGVATDLGHLGDCYSSALAINSESQVVGFTVLCDGTVHRAFLWGKGSMIDLNTLIPPGSSLQLVLASDINDRGEINGEGVPPGVARKDFKTQGHAFLLIPCDENHPGVEGCDYSMVDAPAAVTQTSPPVRNASSRTQPQSLMRRMSPYRFPGPAFGPRN
jgi:probable HAF family extracellular repeat protein